MSIRSTGNSWYDIDQNIAPMQGQLWRLIGLPQAKSRIAPLAYHLCPNLTGKGS